MFRSYWRVIIAVIIGLGVLASGYGYYKIDQSAHSEYAENRYQPARDASFPQRRIAGEAKPKQYDPHCQQPETATDGDLCAQWGAVEAVDESNRLVRLNIMITYVLGALSVVATGAGAVLVYRSLQQTDAALRHAGDVSEKELRPWIGVELVIDSFELTDAELAISYSVIAKNIGSTVATEFVMAATMLFATAAECIEKLDAKQAELRDGNKWGGKKTMIPQDRASYRAVSRAVTETLPWEAGKDSEEVVCMVAVNLAYLTPFHDDPRVSEQSFLIGKKGGGIIKERAIYRNMIGSQACDVVASSFRSGAVT